MITSFEASNFKGFQHVSIPELSSITLLGGRNNVGKTSVLEAVFTLFDRANPQVLVRQFAWRGVEALPMSPEAIWAPVFHDYDMRSEIVLAAAIEGIKHTLRISLSQPVTSQAMLGSSMTGADRTPIIRTDQTAALNAALDLCYQRGDEPDLTSQHTIAVVGGQSQLVLNLNAADRVEQFVSMVLPGIGESHSALATLYGQADVKVGGADSILEFLRIMEPSLRSLSVVAMGNMSMIHGELDGMPRKIPVAYMGGGMVHLLRIILHMVTYRQPILLIDEIDGGIHHSIMAKFWEGVVKAAHRFDCQVIATTHSYECLQAAREGVSGCHEDEFCYVRLERKGAEVKAKTYNYERFSTALDSNMELR